MRSQSVTGILRAVDIAAQHLPDLTVTFTPHCDGATWLVDPETCSIWVNGTTTPDHAGRALTEALHALCRALNVAIPGLVQPRPLRLVYSRTGTA